MKMFRIFLSALTACVFSLGISAEEIPLSTVEGGDDLQKVKRAKFRETYVNMGVDFSQYTQVYLGDAVFDYRDVGPAQRHRSYSSSKSVFGIAEQDRAKFEEIVSDAFVRELEKGKKFKIANSIDESTMIMRGAVLDIVSNAPPEFIGRSEVYLSSVGEATLVMEFLDGKSGEVLARLAERGRIGSGTGRIDQFSMPSNRATIWNDVRRWAVRAAGKLRREIDSAVSE